MAARRILFDTCVSNSQQRHLKRTQNWVTRRGFVVGRRPNPRYLITGCTQQSHCLLPDLTLLRRLLDTTIWLFGRSQGWFQSDFLARRGGFDTCVNDIELLGVIKYHSRWENWL